MTFDSWNIILYLYMYLLCFRLVCVNVGVYYHLQFVHECCQDKEYREIWNVSFHIPVYSCVYPGMCILVYICKKKCEFICMLLKMWDFGCVVLNRERERERISVYLPYFVNSVVDLYMCWGGWFQPSYLSCRLLGTTMDQLGLGGKW